MTKNIGMNKTPDELLDDDDEDDDIDVVPYVSKDPDRTVQDIIKQMYIGIVIYGAIVSIVGSFFARPIYIFILAVIAGCLVASILVYNIYTSLDVALDLGEGHARGYMIKKSFIRLLISAGVMSVAIFVDWCAFAGVTIGLMGVKLTAYMNPAINRFMINHSLGFAKKD